MRLTKAAMAATMALTGAIGAHAEIAARHGLTGDDYQQQFNQIVAQGFRPTHVDGYATAQGMRYAAIWLKSASTRPWAARHGLSTAQFQQQFDQFTQQGFRLQDVSAADGGVFAGIWEKGGGPAWEARAGLDSAAFTQNFNEKTTQGFRARDIEGYQEGGGTRFAVIWMKNTDNRAWYLYRDMTAQSYQQKFNELTGQGFQPVHVDGYGTPNGARFAAIFEKLSGAFVARHNMTSQQYQQEYDNQAGQGFTLKDVSGYMDGNELRYAAVWQK
jgi:hypothetical protein